MIGTWVGSCVVPGILFLFLALYSQLAVDEGQCAES
jgi:hypothetical protein